MTMAGFAAESIAEGILDGELVYSVADVVVDEVVVVDEIVSIPGEYGGVVGFAVSHGPGDLAGVIVRGECELEIVLAGRLGWRQRDGRSRGDCGGGSDATGIGLEVLR